MKKRTPRRKAREGARRRAGLGRKRRALADLVREDWQPRSWGDCIDALRAIGAVYGPHIRAVFRAQLAEGREPRTAQTWIED